MNPTATCRRVWIPGAGHFAHFTPRRHIYRGVLRKSGAARWPTPPGPYDWGGNRSFPIYGNDRYGDCGEAMAAHGDQTFTGALGSESSFDEAALIRQYTRVSGGDNGLSEQDVVDKIWKPGIAGNPTAVIFDALDLPVNPDIVASAIYHFGYVCLGFSVPDQWVNTFDVQGGTVWDAGPAPDPNNGHFVGLNGYAQLRFKVRSWGSWCWLTSAGLQACDAGLFTVFSPRWFDSRGYAPNGLHYTALATLWQSLGGATLPPSPFPAPTPQPAPQPTPQPQPTPAPQPTPDPAPPVGDLVGWWNAGEKTLHRPAGWGVSVRPEGAGGAIIVHTHLDRIEVPSGWTVT